MSTIVMDSSSDLPQSAEPCGSCSLYPSTPSWTSSVLSPGAQEELYDGRDIHVETRLHGLYGLAEGEEGGAEVEEGEEGEEGGPRRAIEAATGDYFRSLFKFLVVTGAVSYAARGLFYRQWGVVDWSTGPFFRADVVLPGIVGVTAGTIATRSTGT